jgi:hypothetical protein
MGYWTTLHLFDEKNFYEKVVPELRGLNGSIKSDYLQFSKSHRTGGIEHFSESELNVFLDNSVSNVHHIANSFDKTFKIHNKFHKIKEYDDRQLSLNKIDGHYDFCKFFEYYIFKTCADFFPHIPLGKGGILRNFNLNEKTLSYSIICELDSENGFFGCGERMGISNWITSEDVELLYLDKENLCFDDNEHATGFMTLLEIAQKNKLGLIMGIDMRECTLELLPKNKLISSNVWTETDMTGLLSLFKRRNILPPT